MSEAHAGFQGWTERSGYKFDDISSQILGAAILPAPDLAKNLRSLLGAEGELVWIGLKEVFDEPTLRLQIGSFALWLTEFQELLADAPPLAAEAITAPPAQSLLVRLPELKSKDQPETV